MITSINTCIKLEIEKVIGVKILTHFIGKDTVGCKICKWYKKGYSYQSNEEYEYVLGDESFDRANNMRYVQGTPDCFSNGDDDTIWSNLRSTLNIKLRSIDFIIIGNRVSLTILYIMRYDQKQDFQNGGMRDSGNSSPVK